MVRLSRRFASKNASLTDLYQLYLLVKMSLPSIGNSLGPDDQNIQRAFIIPLHKFIKAFANFIKLVEDVIDIQRIEAEKEFRVKADFNEELAEAGQVLDDAEAKIMKVHKQLVRDLQVDEKDIKLVNDPKDGYFMAVTNKNEKVIRGKKDLIIIADRKKDGVRFTNNRMREANEDYTSAKRTYESREQEVLSEIMEVIGKPDPECPSF